MRCKVCFNPVATQYIPHILFAADIESELLRHFLSVPWGSHCQQILHPLHYFNEKKNKTWLLLSLVSNVLTTLPSHPTPSVHIPSNRWHRNVAGQTNYLPNYDLPLKSIISRHNGSVFKRGGEWLRGLCKSKQSHYASSGVHRDVPVHPLDRSARNISSTTRFQGFPHCARSQRIVEPLRERLAGEVGKGGKREET